MCLVTYQRKPIKLDHDLIVYKKVYKNTLLDDLSVMAFIRDFIYKLNQVYHCKLSVIKGRRIDKMEFGDMTSQNYYTKNIVKYILFRLWYRKPLIEVSQGFHAYMTKERAEFDDIDEHYRKLILAEFLIPKGSKVYYDATGLIVSNFISFTGKIIK